VFPALLFTGRQSPYYNYIPLIFLLLGLGVMFDKLFMKLALIKKNYLRNAASSMCLYFLIFGIFGLNRNLLDSCFLIQFPWKNYTKDAYLKMINNITDLTQNGQLKTGATVTLTPNLDYPPESMEDPVIKSFLDPSLKQYTYIYDSSNRILEIH